MKGGTAISKFKRLLPVVLYIFLIAIFLIFIQKTDFNLTGYTYYFDEESSVLTIEKGYLNKELNHVIYNVQDNSNAAKALLIILPINKAYQLWAVTIIFLTFYLSCIFYIIFSKKPRLYLGLYLLFLIIFILGDLYIHKELIEEISNALNKL